MLPRRAEREAELRQRLADILRASPETSDNAAGRAAAADGATARKVRRQLEAAGEIPVIRRSGRGKPVSVR